MRSVIQRVRSSRVDVAGRTVAEIEHGLLVLLGVGQGDDESDARFLADKVAHLRIFSDLAGKMNCSVMETSGAVLVVSQFTLLGECRKGRRPSFVEAAPPATARLLYERFCTLLSESGVPVQTGIFQADMQVTIVNDGPVTIILDSRPQISTTDDSDKTDKK